MNAEPLFVYGSLLSPEVQELVIGRKPDCTPARISDYGCYYVKGATFPGMIKESGSQTLGKVLHGLSIREVQALDAYEDSFYRRLPVTVDLANSTQEAMAYVVPVESRKILSDRQWSWDEFSEQHLENYIARMKE